MKNLRCLLFMSLIIPGFLALANLESPNGQSNADILSKLEDILKQFEQAQQPAEDQMLIESGFYRFVEGVWEDVDDNFIPGKPLIVLVHGHGIADEEGVPLLTAGIEALESMSEIANQVVDSHRFAGVLGFNYDLRKDIKEVGDELADFLQSLGENREIILIAHGQGAIVSRWALEQTEDAKTNVSHFISIAAPLDGFVVSDSVKEMLQNPLVSLFLGSSANYLQSLSQLFVDSELMQDLNDRQEETKIATTYHIIQGDLSDSKPTIVTQYLFVTFDAEGNQITTANDGIVPNVSSERLDQILPASEIVAIPSFGISHRAFLETAFVEEQLMPYLDSLIKPKT